MIIRFNRTRFNIRLIPLIIYLFFLVVLCSLGFWQLGRAEEKAVYLEKRQASFNKDNLSPQSIMNADIEAIRYRKIKLSGVYDTEQQFLIDNQIRNGQAGYFVLTPLRLGNDAGAVLVNRGWVVLNKDRKILPEVPINTAKVTVLGRINNFPVVGIKLAGIEIPTKGWPSVVQFVDTKVLADKLGYEILPFQIELDSTMPDGYFRDWKSATIITPEKHIGYAVQWFGLAITLTILLLIISRNKV